MKFFEITVTTDKIGTVTFNTGKPMPLQGFSDGSAISSARNNEIQKQSRDEIEDRIDVFSDETYAHEDFHKDIDAGFRRDQRCKDRQQNHCKLGWARSSDCAKRMGRLDLNQDIGKQTASYLAYSKTIYQLEHFYLKLAST